MGRGTGQERAPLAVVVGGLAVLVGAALFLGLREAPTDRLPDPPPPTARTLAEAVAPLVTWPGRPWTSSRGPIAADDLSLAAGPAHCGMQDALSLQGDLLRAGGGSAQYLRALPGTVAPFNPGLASVERLLDLDAALPADARATGYRSEGVQLWLAPSDRRRFAYVVDAADPSHVERWVAPPYPLGCA